MSDVLLLQHVRPEPPGTIAEALSAHGVPHRTVRVYRDEPVPDRLDADGLVVMGGPMGVGDLDARPHLAQECALIEQALDQDRPVLGVCLGSQLLAHVLGADVHAAPQTEIGWGEVTLTDAAAADPLFEDVDAPFTAFHWHGDVFDLPGGAVRLVQTDSTETQAFRHGDRAYGLLFHLEVTPKTVAWMTTAFQDELAEEGLDGAAIRRDAMTHEPALRETAGTVFGRWADLVEDSSAARE
ncbi:MAG: type 1 glutamine amidotransferase [Salinibacter sp.]